MVDDKLRRSRARHMSGQSPEPEGRSGRQVSDSAPIFAIQKHDVVSLHYDFRLEIDGVSARPVVVCFNDDHLAVNLFGEKLVGGYALTHYRGGNGRRPRLRVRMDAADARRNPVSTQDTSVPSHRTIPEIAGHEGPRGVEGSRS